MDYEIKALKRKSHPLAAYRVLLTRPGSDNDSLAQQLRKSGAVTLTLPCLQILPTEQPQQWQQQLQQLTRCDGIIFTSKHAVEAVKPHWPMRLSAPLYAVGPATAEQIRQAKLADPVVADPPSSEGLLALPALQRVEQQHWAIIGGEKPRTHLLESLQQRGATTTFIACYRRACPLYSADSLLRLDKEALNTVVIQSMGALHNLAHLLQDLPQHSLWSANLIVPNERYPATATKLGFCGKVMIAESASDQSTIDVLLHDARTPT